MTSHFRVSITVGNSTEAIEVDAVSEIDAAVYGALLIGVPVHRVDVAQVADKTDGGPRG